MSVGLGMLCQVRGRTSVKICRKAGFAFLQIFMDTP